MAQTVAAQRGTTTVSGNGGTATTLFTQSTGTATRVILNSVVTKHSESNLDRMALCINVNGTGNLALVAIKQVADMGRSTYGLAMLPDSNYVRLSTTTTGAATYIDSWVQYNSSSNIYLGSSVASGRYEFAGPNGSYQLQNSAPLDQVPGQFWMNSGDSLVILHFNQSNVTADVLYSFTTITES
jgi:hypothetical protein